MAGRVQQDTFMDDSDDCCPLCVEEFDLSDRTFKPCPCGYQVCQFCYNNIKNNMNGLCPACRRQYETKNIQWKVISPEEAKADIAAQVRKKAAQRQKEAERRQVETLNRKHLAGLRVLQKNLVYVVGMNLVGSEDDILETLRGPHHFGQYGDIVKILVSKGKDNVSALGIYVTFVRKEDAATCISALDGTTHEGRTLRAQYGTTKYCSAYLRNEKCNNRSCMFLHETGDDNDSYSRQDLSSLNALNTQRSATTSRSDTSQGVNAQSHTQNQAPPQQALQSIAAASQPSAANAVKSEAMSRSDSGDGSALPTTANWAKNPQIEQSRRSSQAMNRSTPSPKTNQARPAIPRPDSRATESSIPTLEGRGKAKEVPTTVAETAKTRKATGTVRSSKPEGVLRLERAAKNVAECSFSWNLDRTLYDAETLSLIDGFPFLLDPTGGAKRHAKGLEIERERVRQEEERKAQATATADEDENLASGSLQLGGEPETGDGQADVLGRRQFGSTSNNVQGFDGHVSAANDFASLSLGGRSLTPQQQHTISLMKSNSQISEAAAQIPRGSSANASQHQPQLSNPFQAQNQQLSPVSRHGRQSSRFTFANDTAFASTSVKPTINAQMMAQQSSMMPLNSQKSFAGFSQAPLQPSLYTNSYSSIQGPPPGLKSTGTPPISGGGMFGQGHGFASAMGGSLGFGSGNISAKAGNSNDEFVRDIIRGKGNGGLNGAPDGGKLDFADPSILQARMHQTGVGQENYRVTQGQDPSPNYHALDHGHPTPKWPPNLIQESRKSRPGTPAIPPGLSISTKSNPSPGLSTLNDFPSLAASQKPAPYQNPETAQSPIGAPQRTVKPAVPVISQGPEGSTIAKIAQAEQDAGEAAIGSSQQSTNPEQSGPKDAIISRGLLTTANELSKGTQRGDLGIEAKPPGTKIATKQSERQPRPERPGTLDVGATGDSKQSELEAVSSSLQNKQVTPKKNALVSAGPSASGPPTPATATSSPAPRQARTLRVVPLTKPEDSWTAQPPGSAIHAMGSARQASRQPSLASINQPGTPINENMSETASITSASLSRPASPHFGNKVGAAPVRQKTKSQAKKDRQLRAKAEESKLSEEIASAPVEEVQAPILGRKKKTRKERTQNSRRATVESEAPSPSGTKIENNECLSEVNAPPESPQKSSKPAHSDYRGVQEEPPFTLELPPAKTEPKPGVPLEASSKTTLTASSLYAQLYNNGEITNESLEAFLSVPGFNHRFDSGDYGMMYNTRFPVLRKKQKDTLNSGEAVCMHVSAEECAIVLPDRTVLRHLSKAEAERYLDLRNSIAANDPAFLASSRLPACMSMNMEWDAFTPLGPSLSSSDMILYPDHADVSQIYAESLLRSFDGRPLKLPGETSRPLENDGLASQVEAMNLEEADQALKQSEEDAVAPARKAAEMAEKKVNQLVKKNKKLFREWY